MCHLCPRGGFTSRQGRHLWVEPGATGSGTSPNDPADPADGLRRARFASKVTLGPGVYRGPYTVAYDLTVDAKPDAKPEVFASLPAHTNLEVERDVTVSTTADLLHMAAMPGATVRLESGVYVVPTFTPAAGVTVRSAPGHHAAIDGTVVVSSPGCTFRDVEIHDSSTVRTTRGSTSFNVLAPDTTVINCLAFDAGVALFSANENVLFCGNITNGQGWQVDAADRGHGHSAYIQNDGPGRVTLDSNIFGPGFGWSAHAYSQTAGKLEAQTWRRNTAWGAGQLHDPPTSYTFLLSGTVPAHDYEVVGNLLYGHGLQLSYDRAQNGALTFDGGRIDNPPSQQPNTSKWSPVTVVSPALVNPGTLGVYVYPNEYEAGRANITVFNPRDLETVEADCTGIVGASDPWYLYDGFNPLAGPVSSGTGPTVTVPMTGLTCRTPAGVAAPTHPCPKFGAFVVRPVASWVAP